MESALPGHLIMKKLLPFISSFFFILTACSPKAAVKLAPAPVLTGNYSSIAVAKFVSPEPEIGQRVAERLAVKLTETGYSVTSFEKLRKTSRKNVLLSPELTQTDKAVLQTNGIGAVLYGTIDRYACSTGEKWSWTGFAPEKASFQSCTASLSIKIVDSSTGLTVWQTNDSHSEKSPDITARMVLERVLTHIEDEIPKIAPLGQ